MAKNLNISRRKAQELIKQGRVLVNQKSAKSAYEVGLEDEICFEREQDFVSRAGHKLWGFLSQNPHLLQKIKNKKILDVGSSTGGFTQALLKAGARSVHCVDVGRDQLDAALRRDARVSVFENCDIRKFSPHDGYDLLTCDVSFISLEAVFSALRRLSHEMILLYKPQFQLGRGARLSKKGVIKDEDAVKKALESFVHFVRDQGYEILDFRASCLKGKEGNQEYFFWIQKMIDLERMSPLFIESLALGKFDGMHRAHQELFSFLLPSRALLVIDPSAVGILSDLSMRQSWIDFPLFCLHLESVRHWSGEDFVAFLHQKFPALKRLVVGYDFCFGKNRSCDAQRLRAIAKDLGIEVVIVGEVKLHRIPIHSGVIKTALQRGYLRAAKALLGRNYQLKARVVSGQGLGKKALFATLNFDCHPFFLPKNGVYAMRCQGFLAAGFVGIRSTDGAFSVELHWLENSNLAQEVTLGDVLVLEFLAYIRENRHFEDLAQLKEAIERDITAIQAFAPFC